MTSDLNYETSTCIQISAAISTKPNIKIDESFIGIHCVFHDDRTLYILCPGIFVFRVMGWELLLLYFNDKAKTLNSFITPKAAKSEAKYLCQPYNNTLLLDINVIFILKMPNPITQPVKSENRISTISLQRNFTVICQSYWSFFLEEQ